MKTKTGNWKGLEYLNGEVCPWVSGILTTQLESISRLVVLGAERIPIVDAGDNERADKATLGGAIHGFVIHAYRLATPRRSPKTGHT